MFTVKIFFVRIYSVVHEVLSACLVFRRLIKCALAPASVCFLTTILSLSLTLIHYLPLSYTNKRLSRHINTHPSIWTDENRNASIGNLLIAKLFIYRKNLVNCKKTSLYEVKRHITFVLDRTYARIDSDKYEIHCRLT